MTGASTGGDCGAHAGLGAELRGTALLLLDRVRAIVEPIRAADGAPAPGPGSAGACRACPVCAVVALLRGENSELAARVAEHAAGLVAVLAAVLEAEAARPDGGPRGDRPDADRYREDPRARPSRERRTGDGRIPVDRPGAEHTGESPRPGYAPRVPGAHGRSVQRIVVHRR